MIIYHHVRKIDAMRVEIIIELGNDAMRTDAHVAACLRRVADKWKKNGPIVQAQSYRGRVFTIMDLNGNTVGEAKLV